MQRQGQSVWTYCPISIASKIYDKESPDLACKLSQSIINLQFEWRGGFPSSGHLVYYIKVPEDHEARKKPRSKKRQHKKGFMKGPAPIQEGSFMKSGVCLSIILI